MKKLLKIIGLFLLAVLLLVTGLLLYLSLRPFVPGNYTETVETGGEIEANYLAMGTFSVKYLEEKAEEPIKKYEIYYPSELENGSGEYPAVVFVNGTGVAASRYKALFRHLASWGFIVIGNEDPGTGTGESADRTVQHLLDLNQDSSSVLYHHVDTEHIGLSGHSQGGAGVLSVISAGEHRTFWKTAVALSPTHEEMAHALGWIYDMENIEIPILMFAGTSGDFETQAVIPAEAMLAMYEKIAAPKAMARRIGAEHGDMLYCADGYVTAWFMWRLNGDTEAALAFDGNDPEMMRNALYQNQDIHFSD